MNAKRWYDPEDESNIMRETHMKKAPSKYLKLFLSTFYLSAFTFGGGYVIVTLLKHIRPFESWKLADIREWP